MLFKNDDVFEVNRILYRIPYQGDVIVFSPSTATVMKANSNVVKIIDTCSFPTTFQHIIHSFNATDSEVLQEVVSILSRLYDSGYLSLNGSFCGIIEDNKERIPIEVQHGPWSASVHLTDRCTLDCAYCYNANTRKLQRTEHNFEEWKEILRALVSSGVKQVTATGGEPFLRSDLFPLFQELRDEGVHTIIITNGTLLSKDNILKTRNSFEHIVISLDSHIQEINDLNRGSGSYDRIMKSIHLLEENGISYTINSVLTKHNILEFIEMKDYFQRKYKYCKEIKPIIYEWTSVNDELRPSYAQVDRYLFELYDYLSSECGFTAVATDQKKGMMVLKNGCGTGLAECAIGPDGSVYPCRALYDERLNAGNILEEGFMSIWKNSKILREVRYADINRPSKCRDKECDFFHYCMGSCFGHTFATIGELIPWASDFDCIRIKQQMRQKLIAMVMSAQEGKSVLKTI